jgi:hypothetical protein
MFVAGLKPPRKWGGWVAALIIPYMCVSLGEAMIDTENRLRFTIFVLCTVVVFFAAMDCVRVSGTSLRR